MDGNVPDVNIPRVAAAIFRTGQTILAERLKHLDVSGGEMDIFYVVGSWEGLSQIDLARYTNVGKSSVTKVIKSLETKGYVRRDREPHDQRVWRVFLTEKGRDVTPQVQQIFQEFIHLHHGCLTDDETEQTARALDKVLAALASERGRISETHQEEEHETRIRLVPPMGSVSSRSRDYGVSQ